MNVQRLTTTLFFLTVSSIFVGCGGGLSKPGTEGDSATAPTIATQPTNQTVTAGQTATFSVTAAGTAPLTYQWQQGAMPISGATAPSYTTPAAATSDSGSTFSVVVSNSAGKITSNAATLTVNAALVVPSITQQPSNQTVTAGQTATFSVTAAGTAPLTYQWQQGATPISGATAPSYTTPATATSDSGSTFSVVVSNSAGKITSNAATLTVNAALVVPSITQQPSNQTVTGRPDRDVLGNGCGHRTLDLPVAAGRDRRFPRATVGKLHDTGDNHVRQRTPSSAWS
jgi:hypothetical protein